jgi:phosphohistidine phosphatase
MNRADAGAMELILWRHADAGEPLEDAAQDRERKLTPRGRKQAQRVAGWLAARLPERYLLIGSPAPRAVETAVFLGERVRIDERLAPGVSGAALLAIAGWPAGLEGRPRHVVLVGHQPSLGEAAALALAGSPQAWSLRKGALLWLAARPEDADRPVMLRAAIAPDLV